MNRRGSSYLEVVTFLLVLAILAPVLGRLGVEVVRLSAAGGAEDRLVTDRIVERLRIEGLAGAVVAATGLQIGDRVWSCDELGVYCDGEMIAPGHEMMWDPSDAWITVLVRGQHGPERLLVMESGHDEP